MVNALVIGDIHLDLNKNKEFESNRFMSLFRWIKNDVSDTVFLVGDIFNKAVPSLDEIGLFYKAVNLLQNKSVYLIDGNHEFISSGKSTFDFLPEINFRYIKDDQIKLEGVRVYLVSWSEIYKLKDKVEKGISSLPNILLTHIRCNVPPHIVEEIPTKGIAKTFDKIVAGDIHMTNFKPYDNWWYTGQVYNTKFKQEGLNSALRLIFDKGSVSIEYVYTQFPNKFLKVLTVDEAKKFTNTTNDLFKVRTYGSFTELAGLSDTSSVVYDKIMDTVDYSDYEVASDKVNISKDIKGLIKSEYTLSENSIKFGEGFIDKTINYEEG